MEVIDKNIEVIEKLRPKLYKNVKKYYDEHSDFSKGIEVIEARDGMTALCVERSKRKQRLNSAYKPLQEAEKWAGQYEFQNMNVSVVMFGIGNGIFVREMLRRLAEDAKVFLYEPDADIFMHQLVTEDFSDILSDVRVTIFVNHINGKDFYQCVEDNTHWSMLPTQIVCRHPGYEKLFLEECAEFSRQIKQADEIAVVNCNTISHLSKSIVNNIFKNLHFIKNSNYISEFIEDIPKDVPTIIVSAGPSLDKNIDKLKSAEGKAFIFATDTAVKYLLKHDVHFDAMITLDARKSAKHINDSRCENIPLFCALEAKNIIMEFHKGKKIWFRSGIFIEKLYEKFGRTFPQYNTGGSVATAAYMVSIALGIRKVILIGQDLAFSGENTHAGGVEKHVKNEEYGIKVVEGIDGKEIRSRYDWIIYRDWFEEAICAVKDIELIDATEGGVLIHGSKVMTLADAISEYCTIPFDFQKIIVKKEKTFSDEEYEKVKAECTKLEREFSEIRYKASEAVKCATDLIKAVKAGKGNSAKDEKKVQKLQKVNKYIEETDANELLEIYVADSTTSEVQKINKMTDDANQNMLDTLNISRVVYQELVKGIDELTPLLKESLEKM